MDQEVSDLEQIHLECLIPFCLTSFSFEMPFSFLKNIMFFCNLKPETLKKNSAT